MPALVRLVLACLLVAGPWSSLLAMAGGAAADFTQFTKGSMVRVDHSEWDRLLKRYTVSEADGIRRVAYARLKAEGRGGLKAYIAALQAVEVTSLDRSEQLAFWVNLYNAKTIDIVLDAYPVASIKDINLGGGLLAAVTGGPWKAKVLTVQGRSLSLDDIEHAILRPVFKDARVHYVLNCASLGCPDLDAEALTGATADIRLDAAARNFINHPRAVSISEGSVTLSSIYKWFADDFGSDESAVLAHIRRYAGPALKPKLESITHIGDYRYDWSLNDAR